MKNLKSYFAAAAFIVAVGAAYASSTLAIDSLSKRSKLDNSCTNVITSVNCQPSGQNPCDDTSFTYFANQNCVTPLKKP